VEGYLEQTLARGIGDVEIVGGGVSRERISWSRLP
jgi:hypothetical protein